MEIIKAMKEYNKPLSELADGIQKYPQVLINLPVKEKKDVKQLKSYSLIQKIEKHLKGKGRVLVRYSGTELILRVMVEAKENADIYAKQIAEELKKSFARTTCSNLPVSQLPCQIQTQFFFLLFRLTASNTSAACIFLINPQQARDISQQNPLRL